MYGRACTTGSPFRAFRKEGATTDLCDATELAACRMYQGASSRLEWPGEERG